MASCIITFGRSVNRKQLPLADGSEARSEELELASDNSGTSTIAADDGEDIVDILADFDCWVAIGVDPDAESDNRWPVIAGVAKQFGADKGDKVDVAARS